MLFEKLKKGGIWLVASILMLLISFFADYYISQKTDIELFAQGVNNRLKRIEQEVMATFEDRDLISRTLENKLSPMERLEWDNKDFSLIIYAGDSLVFWTKHQVFPYRSNTQSVTELTIEKVQLESGKYELIKNGIDIGRTYYTLLALVPLSQEYPFENEYLKNGVFDEIGLNPTFRLSLQPPKGLPYTLLPENNIATKIYLHSTPKIYLLPQYYFILFGYGIGLILLCVFLNHISLYIARKSGTWMGFLILLCFALIISQWWILFSWGSIFTTTELFNTERFKLSYFNTSLGDLLVGVGLIGWITVFFYREVRFKPIVDAPYTLKLAVIALFYALIVGFVFITDTFFEAIVLQSNIALDVNDIFRFDIYSLLGFLVLVVLLAILFLFTYKSSQLIRATGINLQVRLLFLLGILSAFTLLNYTDSLSFKTISSLLFSSLLIALFERFIYTNKMTSFWGAVWLIIFSIYTAFLLSHYNNEKDILQRRALAHLLQAERDVEAERRLVRISTKIAVDNGLSELYANTVFVSRKDMLTRFQKQFNDDYLFSKYNIEFHTYDAVGKAIKGEEKPYDVFDDLVRNAEAQVSSYVYFWKYRAISSYILRIPIRKNAEQIGWLVAEITLRPEKAVDLYADLLTPNTAEPLLNDNRYSFAIYDENALLRKRGADYPDPLQTMILPPSGEYLLFREDDRSHLVYRASATKTIFVTKLNESFLRPFSLFSYVFFIFTLAVTLFVVGNYLFQAVPDRLFKRFRPSASLRNRIQFSVISFIMVSFGAIAVLSVFYIKNNYIDYFSDKLLQKNKLIVNRELQNTADSIEGLRIDELAQFHGIEINVYDLKGGLLRTTEPILFSKGLISTKIPYPAFMGLNKPNTQEVSLDENIGGFNFQTTYVLMRKRSGEKLAYLGLPNNFKQDKDLRKDIIGFVQTLLNIYVLLLLAATVITLIIANSITRPLTVIGAQLERVKLGTKNQPIAWNSRDEIGDLIDQYNRMILELEESANQLAQSQREVAWREMAKQVAHEIKNPLTPMKLRIQHLQRVVEIDPSSAREMLDKTAEVLIEQIDNLANIATAFSNFAKMPTPVSENIELNSIVQNVFELFAKEYHHIITRISLPTEILFIFGDKNQLIQVLNNVIKNAQQSIPDDRQGAIQVFLYQENKKAVIKVSDNGCGIPIDRYDKVFVPNFTTKSSGTGLGLAICKNIIEQAGGSIYFESREDIGTRFYIELPLMSK